MLPAALLTAALASPMQPQPPEPVGITFAYGVAPSFFFADEPTAPAPGPAPPAVEELPYRIDWDLYYRQMRTASLGLGLGIAGFGGVIVGATTMVIGALGEDQGVFVGGVGLVLLGSLAYVVGAPVMNAGAGAAARTLQRGQVDIGTGASTASWFLMGSGFALAIAGSSLGLQSVNTAGGLLFLSSYVSAGVQMGANSARRRDHHHMALMIDPVNRGLIVGARF